MKTAQEKGYILISTLFMMSLMMALVGAYSIMSTTELKINRRSSFSTTGFYTAEAGLNIRAEEIRQTFVGYNRPSGTSPDSSNACEGTNLGDGEFACQTHQLSKHRAVTYIEEDPTNPLIITIPPGERYQNLNAQEYRYTVSSTARGPDDRIEAILELRFKSRLVPLFQFVAFYNKDLEILPGPTMNLSGPVHTNGDLYLNGNNQLNIYGQVTTAGSLYRGRKNDSTCMSTPVQIIDPINLIPLINPCPSRTLVTDNDILPYNAMVQHHVDVVTVPEPEHLDADPSQVYFSKADIRLALHLNSSNNPVTSASPTGVEVRSTDNTLLGTNTANLHSGCVGSIDESAPGANDGTPVGFSNTFYNNREGKTIRMLEVDMRAFLNCLHSQGLMINGRGLDDDTEGGLVFHFSVDGPDESSSSNSYGVRIRNASSLQANNGGPSIKGITVVSDQAIYTQGNYNSNGKIPAAILADAFNVLSNNWDLSDSNSNLSLSNRVASNTTINSAVLAGTDTTGGVEGAGGQGGNYNGGLENYPRFHENWSGKTLTYRGSFVSLNNSRHQSGQWVYGNPQYTAPGRNWDYDTDFNDANNLPPLTPRFVYLRQQLFVRKYEIE